MIEMNVFRRASNIIATGLLSTALCLGASIGKAEAWSLEEAAKPYAGVEIRTICDGYAPCVSNKELSEEFTERTGIIVNIEVGDLLTMQTQMFTDQLTEGQYYDFVQVQSIQVPMWAAQGFTTPMSRFLDDPALHDPSLKPEDFISEIMAMTSVVDDVQVGFPFHYIPDFGIMRKDILGNAEERDAFKARYGYDLPPAQDIVMLDSWDQWRDLAEFFTRKKGEKLAGNILERDFYGTAVPFKRHVTLYYWYMGVLHGLGGQAYDDDFNLQFDSAEALAALNFMLDLRQFSPPGYREYTWDESSYNDFCVGNIFIASSWGDTTPYLQISEDCPASAGNITHFVNPGTHTTAAWGSGWLIPTIARNPEAAFLYIQWSVSKEIQARLTPQGWLPTRGDVLDVDWSGHPDISAAMEIHRMYLDKGWLTSLKPHPAGMVLQEIMMEDLSAAGADDMSAEETLADIQRRGTEAFEASSE